MSLPQDLLDRIRRGDTDAIRDVYMYKKRMFLQWSARKFTGLAEADREDAWHDTMIAFIVNVRSGKLLMLTTKLSTYLFSIAEHIFLKKLGRDKREQHIVGQIGQRAGNDMTTGRETEDERTAMRAMMYEAVATLPARQQRMVRLRFIDGRSIAEIRTIMEYESDNAVRVTLSRAVRSIRDQIRRKYNSSGMT